MKNQFISEDDLNTFEGWLRFQAIDLVALQRDQLETWRALYNDAQHKRQSSPKMGLVKFKAVQGQLLYAVAVCDGTNLWLVLWVRRSVRGDVYVFIPRADPDWDPHISYHKDGKSHIKSHGRATLNKVRQPPTRSFLGAEQIVSQKGFGPKTVGATFDPKQFAGVVEIEAGILGPIHGYVSVDLVEPGCETIPHFNDALPVRQMVFKEMIPWLVIRVFAEQF